MKMKLLLSMIVLSLLGLFDAAYLTWEHFSGVLPSCSTGWFVDCGKVLTSPYSEFFGVPVASFGILQYIVVLILSSILFLSWNRKVSWLLLIQTTIGFLFSVYFVALQLFVIGAVCLYCMASALCCTLLFLIAMMLVKDKRAGFFWMLSLLYKVLKFFLFKINPERVHVFFVQFGEVIGNTPLLPNFLSKLFSPSYPKLEQRIANVHFSSPLGLAAGFDYEARLTQVLPLFGFGFQTVGTITHQPCPGNPTPRLQRLPKSKALLVNKGFKNPGAKEVVKKLSSLTFRRPVGVSIGQTNINTFKNQTEVIEDILSSFRRFEKSNVTHQYYELNISCPNIGTTFHFYEPSQLELLLRAVDSLNLKRPLFVKMPISESDETVLSLLKVIAKHSPAGVIIGNLQRNRKDTSVVQSEVKDLGRGNLSGKPCFERSNHLIALTYKHYKNRFVIIGCGGVFSSEDVLLKIQLGATLVQLITGVIFEGPQLIAQMNEELNQTLEILHKDSIRELIGTKNSAYFTDNV